MLSQYRHPHPPKRALAELFPYDDLVPEQELYGLITGINDEAHCACDYNIGIELGFEACWIRLTVTVS